MYSFIPKARTCGDPTAGLSFRKQILLEGPSQTSPPTEGAEWNVKCEIGFVWSDGTYQKQIRCNESGSWAFPSECQSIFEKNFYHFF